MYGKEIKAARLARKYTQKQVSENTGIPQNTISWIESDVGIPSIHQCLLIAEFLGISIEELIGKK